MNNKNLNVIHLVMEIEIEPVENKDEEYKEVLHYSIKGWVGRFKPHFILEKP